jgi:hypothetical protein
MSEPEELVPRRKAAREWNRDPRTIARWEKAKLLGFDEPIAMNGHIYHRRSRLELAKRSRSTHGAQS